MNARLKTEYVRKGWHRWSWVVLDGSTVVATGSASRKHLAEVEARRFRDGYRRALAADGGGEGNFVFIPWRFVLEVASGKRVVALPANRRTRALLAAAGEVVVFSRMLGRSPRVARRVALATEMDCKCCFGKGCEACGWHGRVVAVLFAGKTFDRGTV